MSKKSKTRVVLDVILIIVLYFLYYVIGQQLTKNETIAFGIMLSLLCFLFGCDIYRVMCTNDAAQNNKRLIDAAELSRKFAGHSIYSGDTILSVIACMKEGKTTPFPACPFNLAIMKQGANKEFAKKLKARFVSHGRYPGALISANIDDLLNKMEEVEE